MLKIYLQKGQKLWVTSDTHFGHKNICKGTTEWDISKHPEIVARDYPTLEAMNSAIVDNINSLVGQDDVLLHMGDWSFGGFENIRIFRERIICKNIHIVTGNHDHHIVKNKDNIRSIFTSVSEYYTQLELKYHTVATMGGTEKINVILSHFPICSWDNMNKGWMHWHGHVHLNKNKRLGKGKSLDVGVDGNDLKPYLLKEVVSLLKNQPISNLCIDHDHHEKPTKNL